MIDDARREANDLVKEDIKKSDLDPMMKEVLIQNLAKSLDGTNGHKAEDKLQIVSECTEGQARIISRLCKMESDHHKNMRASLEKINEKLDNNMKAINLALEKVINNNKKDPEVDKNNYALTSRAQWFKFLTRNKVQVFWFSLVIIVLAFITGNIDRILGFLSGLK